jgi:hypothetical protein
MLLRVFHLIFIDDSHMDAIGKLLGESVDDKVRGVPRYSSVVGHPQIHVLVSVHVPKLRTLGPGCVDWMGPIVPLKVAHPSGHHPLRPFK